MFHLYPHCQPRGSHVLGVKSSDDNRAQPNLPVVCGDHLRIKTPSTILNTAVLRIGGGLSTKTKYLQNLGSSHCAALSALRVMEVTVERQPSPQCWMQVTLTLVQPPCHL